MFGKKKPKRKILYAGYTATKQRPIETEKVEEKQKEKKGGEKKQKKWDMEQSGTLVIAVCSLEGKCGCSYLAQAIGRFYDEFGYRSHVVTTEFAEISNLYSQYDVLVLDIGKNRADYADELNRAGIKILLCLNQEDQSSLAQFVRMNQTNWVYLFNLVPKERKKEIEALMEDYPCFFLPLFDPNELVPSIQKLFRQFLPVK